MKRKVLIADGNSGRGRRLCDAFEAADLPWVYASNGAAALEAALNAPPALVVAHRELPLVDAQKLAEILRVNPRTRSVRMNCIAPAPPKEPNSP